MIEKLREEVSMAKAQKARLLDVLSEQQEADQVLNEQLQEPSPHLPVPLSQQSQYRSKMSVFPEMHQEMQRFQSKLLKLLNIDEVVSDI